MVDYSDSSQLNLWQFESPQALSRCRSLANLKAREFLFAQQQDGSTTPSSPQSTPLPIEQFACGFSSSSISKRNDDDEDDEDYSSKGPLSSPKGHEFLTPDEEQVLVSFYVSKLPNLVGPQAPIARCRRESKVTATAALLTRRFFLSNSVMLYDPKIVMVAAAFLAAKVEDATMDIRYLEEGTTFMNAPVTKEEIIPAEIALLTGTHFDLLCFHSLKSVLAFTEDLRTYLKSDQGQGLVISSIATNTTPHQNESPQQQQQQQQRATVLVSGQDLKPMYDAARTLLDDVIVSDLPLLFNPGQVGLAALMVAQDIVHEAAQPQSALPRIDLQGYIRQRFSSDDIEDMLTNLQTICVMLRELREGKWGCGTHSDMGKLKSIHKKLKKVRAWGLKEAKSSKKRDNDTGAEETAKKKQKTTT